MASEIRVNKINSRTGVGTITLSPTGVDFTGIATVATLKATTGIVTTLTATTGIVTTLTVDTTRTTTGIVTTLTADTSRITTGIVTTLTADTAKVGAAVTISESGMEVTGVTTVTSSINIGSATTISSSSLEVNGVQYPTAGALSNRNLIINGAMQVAQRGTSQTGVTSTTYAGPDRFQQILSSAGTWTISQSTEAPEGFSTSLKLDCTTAKASLSASNLYLLGQKIEGFNVQHLDYNTSNAKTTTLSFWVRSNKTGTYVLEVTSSTSTRKISQTYTINSANTWEKKTLQIPGDTGGSLPNTNAAEFNVYWWVAAGTNYTSGTLNTNWGTPADTNRAVGQTVNLADSTSNDFYLTGVQLEVGEKATPFEHRNYGDELARCQRYYYRVNSQTSYNPYGFGSNSTTSAGQAIVQHPVEMRVVPSSLDYSNLASTVLGVSDVLITSAALLAVGNGKLMSTISTSSSGAFTTGFFTLTAKQTTSSYIGFSAEL